MFANVIKQMKTATILLLLMILLTGLIYPAIVTLLAQMIFPWQANGSLIKSKNKIIGSVLIGQSFSEPKYFWGRPSATQPYPYNATNSAGSNLGPSNPALKIIVMQRIAQFQKTDPKNTNDIPVDLVTASASGLDPEISPLAAVYQIPRVAAARKLSEQQINMLINTLIINPTFGMLGQARINVLQLNIALDNLQNTTGSDNDSRKTKS